MHFIFKSMKYSLLVLCVLCAALRCADASVQSNWAKIVESNRKRKLESTRLAGTETGLPTSSDYDTYMFTKAPANGDNDLYTERVTGTYNSTGRAYSGYFASFHPDSFSFYPAIEKGCLKLVDSSKIAAADWHAECEYATNGGFFNMDGLVDGSYCIGNLISYGTTVQMQNDAANPASVGVTSDGRAVFGNISGPDTESLPLREVLSANGWLVRHGRIYVNETTDWNQPAIDHEFVTEKAPRTAVGWLSGSGKMALLQVDGIEDLNLGPDLFEFSELAVNLGFDTLINIDGGGSSVSIQDGEVISRPTCDDTGRVCERKDANIACVRRTA
jgi:hypothetical protein